MTQLPLSLWCAAEPSGEILAVLGPPGGPARWLQVLLSFLPHVVAAVLLLGGLLAFLKWFPRFSFRMRLVVVAVLALAISTGWAGLMLLPGRPPPRQGHTRVGEWATFMGSAYRTGHADAAGGPALGEKMWAFRDRLLRAPFAGSPAVAGGRVYVGSDNRRLYCFDAETGKVVWTFKAGNELFASPAVAGGRVFLGEGLHHTTDAKLYCLDAASGRKLWEFQTASHIEFGPSLFDGKVYFGAGEDGIYCLDARSGKKVWQYPGVHVDMSPAVTAEGVFFGNVYGSPAFYCLDPKDGKLLWRMPAPYGVCGSPSTDGRRVYFGLGNGTFEMSHADPLGAVACLSAEDGRVLWTTTCVGDSVLTTVALWRGSAFFGSRDGRLYCVSAETGRRRWSYDAGQPVLSSPAVAGGRVYFGCDDGCVYCLDAASGRRLWRYDTSRAAFNTDARVIASPAVAGGKVYVGSMNFFFFCLGESTTGE